MQVSYYSHSRHKKPGHAKKRHIDRKHSKPRCRVGDPKNDCIIRDKNGHVLGIKG